MEKFRRIFGILAVLSILIVFPAKAISEKSHAETRIEAEAKAVTEAEANAEAKAETKLAAKAVSEAEAEDRDSVRVLPDLVTTGAAKTNVTLLPLNTNVVTAAAIEKTAESNILPVLVSKVPGLFVTERGFAGYGVSGGAAGAVSIRGVGQGNKVLFMIDGQPQWAGVFGHALPDTYVANGVERVEVVKGPSSLLYGSNAMGGSVNIITRRQRQDGWFGRARAVFGSYSTQKFDLSTGFKKGKFGGMAAGSVDRSNGYRANSAFWEANGLVQFQYNPSEHWEAGTTVDLTKTHADNPGTVQSPLENMWTSLFRGAASVYVKNMYEKTNGGFQAFINWGKNRVDDGNDPGSEPRDYLFNSTDRNIGFTLYQTMNFWLGNDLSAGIDFLHWGGHIWNTQKADPSERSSEFKKFENEIAGYLMMQQALWGDILSLNAGVRLQHGSQYGNEWIPQAGFVLKPYRGGSVKFSFSKGFRAPNLRELYLYPPHNPDLKPEYLWNYDVELRQWLFERRLNIGLSLYYINAKNIIQTTRVDGRPLNVNSGSFINKGFEIDAAFAISREWQVSANYSYLHTTSRNLLGAPKNKLNGEVNYSPGALSLTLESNTIWSLYTGSETTQSYSLLNFRAGYTFHARCDIMPFVKLDNITNSHYEILEGCPMPGTTILGGVEIKF